jgi:hypothetical protein
LLALREELASEEERLASRRTALAREAFATPEPEHVAVPSGEWRSWFEGDADGR